MLQGSIKIFSVVGLLLGLFGVAYSADVKPFVYENIAQDSATQQDQFDYMLQYKLYGHDFIKIGNDVSIPDKSGWNGTEGNITTNARLTLGGPVLAAGTISLGDGAHTLTGPIRADFVTVGNPNNSVLNSPVCLANTNVDQKITDIIDNHTVYSFDSLVCSNDVPAAPSNLYMPVVDWDNLGADTVLTSIDISYDNDLSATFTVPDGDAPYKILVEQIHLCKVSNASGSSYNGCHLYINMQDGGRLTQIFVKDLVIGNHSTIQVSYRTDDGDVVQEQSKYRGNLMFYTNSLVNLDNTDFAPIQGTFISTDSIYLGRNINIAGQLLSNKLEIGNDLKGENFRFVKFDPDTLDFDPELNKTGGLLENDSTVIIPIQLSDTATNAVTFTYCFDLDGGTSAADGVNEYDFNTDSTAFPICGVDTPRAVVIPVGQKVPSDLIKINVKYDTIIEPKDSLTIKIHIAEGAILPNGKFDGELKIKIVDATVPPRPYFDTTYVYTEKEEYTGFVDSIRVIGGKSTTRLSLDSAYTGRYSLDEVTGVLTLLSPVDYESTQIDTLKITLTDVDNVSITRYFPITVIDVNEKPTVRDTAFSVDENSSAGTFVGQVEAKDPDVLNPAFGTLAYSLADSTIGAASKFTIDSDGKIRVAANAGLDYEKDSVLFVKVVVSDGYVNPDGSIYSDTALVTIRLGDVDESPKIIVDEDKNGKDDTEDDSTCVSGCTTDNRGSGPDSILTVGVKENSPTDKVVFEYVVADEDRDEVSRLNPELRDNNGSGVDSLFKIEMKQDPQSGAWKVVVSVADSSKLDFESIKATHEVTVVVRDSTGLADSIVRVIQVIDVNELPILGPQEFELEEHKSVSGDTVVVGTMVSGDMDKNSKFTQNVFTAVGGDTDVFSVTPDGRIVANKEFDYETERKTYEIKVALTDKDDPTLTVIQTMTINIKNVPEVPRIKDTEFEVNENVPDSTEIGTITSTDPDGEDDPRTYKLVEESDYVIVTDDGKILVKDSTKFDFEKVEEFTIKVSVTDAEGLSSDTLITIKVKDVNEAPVIPDQELKVKEDKGVGDVVGTVVASDPDVLNPDFGTLTFSLVGESDLFEVKEDGTVLLKDTLDWETDSVYVIHVRVTDGELSDTALVTIRVENVLEWTEVEITRAETRDSVWLNPDTIFVNTTDVCIEWKADNKVKGPECDLDLEEGTNIITRSWKDPTKDFEGVDTLIVIVSTKSPIVTVTKAVDEIAPPNIFTIIEKQDESDSSFYVNDKKNDILVTVKDPVSGTKDSFVVKLNLDTLKIPTKTFTGTLDKLVDAKLTLDKNPASGITSTPVNDNRVANSYTEVVDGKEVTVTYYTDKDGKVIKNEDGVKVMTVTYETKVDGKTVKISYQVDSKTGKMLKNAGGYASDSDEKAEENVAFTVSYDYVDEAGNAVTVSYGVDKKGNLVRDGSGNLGYEVGYTYTNKFGNSATQSVFIVLDLVPPKVEILSPLEGDVIYSNFVDVKWTVDIGDGRGAVVQDTLVTQGLQKGGNAIVRFFRDKAGNMASDTIRVIMKNAKDVDISVEKPVTIVTQKKVEEYYAANEPKKGETFAVSIYNTKTDKEVETIIGGEFKNKKGSGDEPYPGLTGHLGPTLAIETKVPTVNALGGLATLDDLLNSEGLVPLQGVDAENSEKVTVDEYVEKYCSDEFAESLGSDLSRANLSTTKMKVKIWIYTSLGQFVDYYTFTQDLDDPDYVNDAGMLTLFFEMKPDRDGNVRTENGRLYATGAYVYKTEVELKSTLRCSIPPVGEKAKQTNTKGSVRTAKEDLLKSFGYKRPNIK